ncbi:(S)-benzoin forming benzil reductase [Pontibacillus salicampi]|uniref:(S)-benzoin forming benzil reductase n=1 Tax=Pontibacillus salicampi TaxID=1449801 RepID=A0ABV6LT42_9BACI
MHYAVITGVSKGLGASIAEELMQKGIHIIGISRSINERLQEKADQHQVSYTHYSCDLSSVADLEEVFGAVAERLSQIEAQSVYVVNNAGVVEPIDRVGSLASQHVVQHVHVNYIAPMLITNLMYQQLATTPVTVVNITSGAAEKTIYGWSVYGSTKAALNHFTRTVAVEQGEGSKHVSIAFSPGVMDTDMQGDIRSSSKEAFQDVEKFQQMKQQGMLRDTTVVAQAVVRLLFQETISNGQVYHVNDLLDE